jgi:hypothetical protein
MGVARVREGSRERAGKRVKTPEGVADLMAEAGLLSVKEV